MSRLDGFNIAVSEHLVGSKKAVKMGDTICVSPAMWALMKDATPEELKKLFGNIGLVDIGEPLDFTSLPMTTKYEG